MPLYLVRKTETYHVLIEAPTADEAEDEAEDMPEDAWEQSDGPSFEAEPVPPSQHTDAKRA